MARSLVGGATMAGVFLVLTLSISCVLARSYEKLQESAVYARSYNVITDGTTPTVANVKNEVHKLVSALSMQINHKEKVACKIVVHLRKVFPSLNVLVVHAVHLQDFQDSVEEVVRIRTGQHGFTSYSVYAFRRGVFTLPADGNDVHWCFSGNYKRHGDETTFLNP